MDPASWPSLAMPITRPRPIASWGWVNNALGLYGRFLQTLYEKVSLAHKTGL